MKRNRNYRHFIFMIFLLCSITITACQGTNQPEENENQESEGITNTPYRLNNMEKDNTVQVQPPSVEESNPVQELQQTKKETTKNSSTEENQYSILINTSTLKLDLLKDGQTIKTYDVAVGKSSTPTPKGTYKITEKAKNPGGPYGTRWMGLSIPGDKYGIHGTNNPSSIGDDVSHGCIRMNNEDANDLFTIVPVGTIVKIS